MDLYLKKISGSLILIIGLILFFISLLNNNFNLSLVALTTTIIIWVIFGLLSNTFNIQIFSLIISSAGFILSICVFFVYGVEQVAHPIGAIVFHSNGIAGSLGIGLFSLFPILIIYQLKSEQVNTKTKLPMENENLTSDPNIESDDWEFVTDEELESGDYEIK